MTTPDVPYRLEFSIEVPGTPEQVWEAIATAKGMSAWFLPTDMEEREGGAIYFHMGDEGGSAGTVTGWDPPRRMVYEEPDWAAMGGQQEDVVVTPLVSEFLVEARDGGTCVVRVVSSAFGTGADWENEMFEGMESGWLPMFDHLKIYLSHFAGQSAETMLLMNKAEREPADVWKAVVDELGVERVGQAVTHRDGTSGVVERLDARRVLIRLLDPSSGILALAVHGSDDASEAMVAVTGYFFGSDADEHAARETAQWRAWIEQL